ncbi:MAG: hypothetical protein BDTLLHRC_000339 [Candidatus Fervidibacter sp.]
METMLERFQLLQRQNRLLKWCLVLCLILAALLLSPLVRYQYYPCRMSSGGASITVLVCVDRLTGQTWMLMPFPGLAQKANLKGWVPITR